jgi:DNA-binding XRE family transcriptional regulator
MRITPLATARQTHGLSSSELAQAIGTDAETLIDWECGVHNPPPEMAVRLARWLQIPLCDVYWPLIEAEAAAGRIPPNVGAREAARHPHVLARRDGQLVLERQA